MRGQRHVPAAFNPGKDPVHIVQEAGWVPGPVWTGAENLAPTGIRSPDRPARSQSLNRLRYPAHNCIYIVQFILDNIVDVYSVYEFIVKYCVLQLYVNTFHFLSYSPMKPVNMAETCSC